MKSHHKCKKIRITYCTLYLVILHRVVHHLNSLFYFPRSVFETIFIAFAQHL